MVKKIIIIIYSDQIIIYQKNLLGDDFMDKNKKILSKLLIPMLVVSGIKADAMEEKKVKSMKDYPLPLSENLKCDCEHYYLNKDADAKWYNVDALMTKAELEKFLNDHRQDIFYAMHQGNVPRALANGEILRKQNFLINMFTRWRDCAKKIKKHCN